MSPTRELESFLARLPKVELHLHLEGAVQPETLRELSRRKGWPRRKIAEWVSRRRQQHYRYRNFQDFLKAFGMITLLLEEPEDYALATTRLMEWLAAQNVKYAEVILSAGVVLWKRQSLEKVFEASAEAARAAGARLGMHINWIFDAIRHFGKRHVRQVLHAAARYRSQGVVAFGIGGDEVRGPAELFAEIYREARGLGLHVVAHAGEAAGAESVRHAIELLGAERIGHGLKFLAGGLVVTLNSDDPAMFGTSLENEYLQAARCFGLSREVMAELARQAARSAFLPEEDKRALVEEIDRATL
ncbi:MAG: adenosine deaminase [Acidobacteriia bacterium]|nr:adenosine deaminase [Terriglobia bacterium]